MRIRHPIDNAAQRFCIDVAIYPDACVPTKFDRYIAVFSA